MLDQIRQHSGNSNVFITNNQVMSIAEKSLVSNIKKGLSLHERPSSLPAADAEWKSSYNVQELAHPQVNMGRLSEEQQEEISFYISQIQRLEQDCRQIK